MLYLIRLYRQFPGFDGLAKPGPPQGTKPVGQCELPVPPHARIQPGGGVAEALATVLPPPEAARADIGSAQTPLPPLRRPAELSPRSCPPFVAQQVFKGATPRIAQPQPDEMKELMNENARKLGAAAIEGNPPRAQE